MAEDLIAARRFSDARAVVAGAQPPDREDGALLVLEGRAWLLDKDLVRAQAALLRAVRAAPGLADPYRWLGHVLLKRGDPQRAHKTLRHARELAPDDPEILKLLTRAQHLSEAASHEQITAPSEPPLGTPWQPTAAAAPPPALGRAPVPPNPPRAPHVRGPSAPARPGSIDPNVASARGGRAPTSGPAIPRLPARKERSEPDSEPVPSGEDLPASFFDDAPDDSAEADADTEPSSQFRELSRRPGPARSSSGPIRSTRPTQSRRDVEPGSAGGRYSAQNITAEQILAPFATPSATRSAAIPPSSKQPPRPDSRSLASRPAARGRSQGGELDPRGRVSPSAAKTPAATRPARSDAASRPSSRPDDEPLLEGVPVAAEEPPPIEAPGSPADAERALELVKRYGLFEQPRTAAAEWSSGAQSESRGTRVKGALIALWVITLLAAAGGYFGWHAFVERRHAKAAAWVAESRALMQRGDHAALVDAERLLRLAREQHPVSSAIPNEQLRLQIQRVLDDGERDLAALKIAMARAPKDAEGAAASSVAAAVIAAYAGDPGARDRALEAARLHARPEPRLVYLLARLSQRLARPEARAELEAAQAADPASMPARLALAELALDAGERADALQRVDDVLAVHKEHLRARLFRLFVRSDDADTSGLEVDLAAFHEAMKLGGTPDQLLLALTQARLFRRQDRLEEASKAVERADAAAVDDPRLLVWVAREALAVRKPALAQHAAGQALRLAPDVAPYRRLLARVLIERGDGPRARELLSKLPADDTEAQIMLAQAALLEDDPAALRAGLDALSQPAFVQLGPSVRVGTLRVRLESKLAPGKAVVDEAKALLRSAPGDPQALLALAEAALAARDPATATHALKQRIAVAPDDATAHYLLGRARRMLADAAGAEASFRQALTLSPGQGDALSALGGLLLDQGKYEEADAVFQELASRGGSALAGRLGRVEALVGLERRADARVQLDSVPEAQRTGAAYRAAAARLALAEAKPGDALTLLQPMVGAQAGQPELLSLYGDALLAAQQFSGAADAFARALALDPGLPEALLGKAQGELLAGRANDALSPLEAARAALATRIRPAALSAQRLTLLGWAYITRNKRGDLALAEPALREALRLRGAPAVAHYWLAEALGGKTNPEARAEYQRYLELAPGGKYADRARRAVGAAG